MSRARDLAAGTFSGAFSADSPTLVVDSTNNRVGMGAASPSATLEVNSVTSNAARLKVGRSTSHSNYFEIGTDGGESTLRATGASSVNGSMIFERNNGTTTTESMRIDSSGNLLVGKTSTVLADVGHNFNPSGFSFHTRDGGGVAYFNRKTSDGELVIFYKDGTTSGGITVHGTDLGMGSGDTGFRIQASSDSIFPYNALSNSGRDNAIDLGKSDNRFDDVYATNGTIQTSCASEKQDIAELDEAEKRVATAAKGLIRKFRWISSVEEKGDDARIHVGIIAQDLKAAFEAEGLDPGRYAMFISSTWWEADETYTDDEGVEQTRTNTYDTAEEAPEGAVERTRLGVRYNQLLAFIIGAM